jgi:hypothetical protein
MPETKNMRVPLTGLTKFFIRENWMLGFWWRPHFRIAFGHIDFGYIAIGEDLCWGAFHISGGFWPRRGVRPGEIRWRWYFSVAPQRWIPLPLRVNGKLAGYRWRGRYRIVRRV